MRSVSLAVSSLRAALRNPGLRRVELAWGATVVAEWMHFVALGVFAYAAGGTTAVGLAGAIRMLPAALLATFAAALGDRFPRERVLAATAAVGALALAASAAGAAAESEALVYAAAAVVGIALTIVRPTQQALLPSLARTPDELVAANGTTSTVESIATLAGPLLAGFLVAQTSVATAFGVAAAALLVATLSFALVHVEGRIELTSSARTVPGWRDLAAGLAVVARSPRPRLVVGLFVAQGFVRGCLNVLIVVAAFEILDAGAGAVGYMTAALGVGGLLGALGAYALAGRGLAVPFALALVFWGVPIALLAPLPYVATAVVFLAVVGMANSVEDVAGFTLVQRIVRDDVLSRVLGTLWGLAMGAVALGSLAAPLVVDATSARGALVVVGAILPALILVTWRGLAAIDRDVGRPAAGLASVARVPMFAPLSLAAKEEIAARLDPVSARTGETVIRAGDVGDRFYIVTSGELRVQADGATSTMREGDSFGEIALLRDVPRTATVEAVADSELLALERDDFLAAVTGHREARAAGESVAASRLREPAQTAGAPRPPLHPEKGE